MKIIILTITLIYSCSSLAKPKAYEAWSVATLWGGLAVALVYMFTTNDKEYRSGVYFGIFGTGLITSIILRTAANAQLVKSLNQYNGVYKKETSWKNRLGLKDLNLVYSF